MSELPETDVPTGGPQGPPVAEAAPAPEEERPLTVEDLLAELEAVIAQRDEYLGLAQAKQAEFENFRKRMLKQQAEEVARTAAKLVDALLPVLDAFDYGVAHGDESLAPMRAQLLGALEREGLVRLDPTGEAFDPNEHEAVAHEAAEEADDTPGPVVSETMRAGYLWHGHLLRPAMVKVKG